MDVQKTSKATTIQLHGYIKKQDYSDEEQKSQVTKVSFEDGDVKALNFTFVPAIRLLPAVHKVVCTPNKQVKSNQNAISVPVKKLKQSAEHAWSSTAWHFHLEDQSLKDKDMHHDGVFKAEIVYLGDSDGGDEDQKYSQSGQEYSDLQKPTVLQSIYEPPQNRLQAITSESVPFTSSKTYEEKYLKLNSSASSMSSDGQLSTTISTSHSETYAKENNVYNTLNENKCIVAENGSDKLYSNTELHNKTPQTLSLFSGLHLSTFKFPSPEAVTVTATKQPARDNINHNISVGQISDQNSLPYHLYNNSEKTSPLQRDTMTPSPLHFISSGTLSPPLSVSPCPSGRSSTLSPLPLQIIRRCLTPSPVCLQIPCKRLYSSTGSINQLYSQLPQSSTVKQSRAKSPRLTQLSLLTAVLKSGQHIPSGDTASSTKHFHENVYCSPFPTSKACTERKDEAIFSAQETSFKVCSEKTNGLISKNHKRSLYGQPNDTIANPQISKKANVPGRHLQKTLHSLTDQLRLKPNLQHHEHRKFRSVTPDPKFPWTSSSVFSYSPTTKSTLSSTVQKTSCNTSLCTSTLPPSSAPLSVRTATLPALQSRQQLLGSNIHSSSDLNRSISPFKSGPLESPRCEHVCSPSCTSRKHLFHSSLPNIKHPSVLSHPDSSTHSDKPGFHPLLRKSYLNTQTSNNLSHAALTGNEHPKANLQNKHIPSGFTSHSLHRSQPLLCTSISKSGKLSPAQFLPDPAERKATKSKEYKITSSYKTLAAVPTNKLLLDQKETDKIIQTTEKSSSDHFRDKPLLETHSQLSSPSQLRQQSEELYATIDRVIQESTPRHRSASVPISQRRMLDSNGSKITQTLPRSAGRETKYAQLNSPPSISQEKKRLLCDVGRTVKVSYHILP